MYVLISLIFVFAYLKIIRPLYNAYKSNINDKWYKIIDGDTNPFTIKYTKMSVYIILDVKNRWVTYEKKIIKTGSDFETIESYTVGSMRAWKFYMFMLNGYKKRK